MNGESINLERDIKLVRKYLNISKPSGVSKVEFDLRPIDDEYYMNITYVVPEDSKYLKVDNRPNDIHVNYRSKWNHHITKDLKDYFGINVYINQSGTRNEKFNYGK
jgi:hypothetical protein